MCVVRRVYLHPTVSLTCLLCCVLLTAGQAASVTEVPTCNGTYFRCATSGCLNASLVCDGQDNCGDNSDEDIRYAGCQGSHRLSGGLIAAIAIGSLVGAVLLCCWISSVIECIQHMYKYWCSCCHDADLSDITFTTTVIPNPGADPATIVIAGTLPPSYSSIFRNDAAFLAEASQTSLPTYQNGSLYTASPPISAGFGGAGFGGSGGGSGAGSVVGFVGAGGGGAAGGGSGSAGGSGAGTPSGPRSLPQMPSNMVVSQHCQHCQCQCQRQQPQTLHRAGLPQSASLPLPDYPPPRYDPAKDIRWC